jgi:hypothetical protein
VTERSATSARKEKVRHVLTTCDPRVIMQDAITHDTKDTSMKTQTELTAIVDEMFKRIAEGAKLTYDVYENDEGLVELHVGLDQDFDEYDFIFSGKS